MAWDITTQYMAHMGGALVEFGTATMGTAGTVEVATNIPVLRTASATWKAPGAVRTILIGSHIMCDMTKTTDAVTFSDSAGAGNAGATFTYMLVGW